MKIVVFDFEVFKYDVLLGAIELTGGEPTVFQSWNKEEIKSFYYKNQNSVWVGHNNTDYDNIILEAIIRGNNPYEVSQDIVNHIKRYYLNIKLNYYDIMSLHMTSLKTLEASVGKRISETEVDFNLDRPLTEQEKLQTEVYNRDDLNQTLSDLKMVKSEFQLRFDLIKEFNLSLDALHYTQTQIAEAVLKVSPNKEITSIPVKPVIYDNLKVNNEEVLNYYLNEEFKTSKKLKINICGLEHLMGAGGIHAGRKCCTYDWAFYLDVSGYYNLVMINYNLFSRTLSEEGKKLYEFMYHEQLRLKKTNPVKRAIYKTILLAVFGAQMNEHCKFYDPWNGALVPVVGQMFLVDLLEKLDGKIELIQSNTDGIMVKPLEGVSEQEILDIVDEWCNRTKFVIKPKKIYDIHQRDVNNYMYRDEDGQIHTKGEAVKYYECWENPLLADSYNSKEPIIIHYGIVEYLMNGIKPEVTIVKYAKDLRMFQYICKVQSYDYLTFEKSGKIMKLQKVNRCFASKEVGMIYKVKPNKHDKYSNLPDQVFVWNEDLSKLNPKLIDYRYYAKRIYERINEFKPNHFQKKSVQKTEKTGQLSLFDFTNN